MNDPFSIDPKLLSSFNDLINDSSSQNEMIISVIHRMNHIHLLKIDEKNRIIDILREEIKELNQEIVKLKFKTG
jgi:hypothetical protein